MNKEKKKELALFAVEGRMNVIRATHAAGSGHPGGSLSAMDYMTYLYNEEIRVDPKNPKDPDRDRFVLSKGHVNPGLYAVLAQRGFFDESVLLTLRQPGSILQGHPNMNLTPGVDLSTGSLGQGISGAAGMAKGAKYLGKDIDVADLVKAAKAAFAAETGKKESDVKGVELYLKTEENRAYYVINGEFTAEISLGDRKETRKFPVKDAPIGEVSSIGEVAFPVPALEKPEQVKIAVLLTTVGPNEGAKTTQINQNVWTSWFFPAEIRPDASIAPAIYADEMVKYAIPDWNLQSIPDSDKTQGKELPANAVYIVSWLDADVASAVKRGARCVLLGDLERLESIPITYKQTWWKAGDSEAQNHCGTFVYSDSLTDSVTRDHWCDGAWCELLDGANKFKVESAPTAPQTLIRALPSLVLVQNTPLVFRVRVGSGLLTVSGLNHFSEGALKNPLNAWLVREMLYPVSAKETLPSWPVEFLAPEKSLPPGMSLGFRKVISSPRATSGLSYYSPNTTLFIARQTEAGNLVSWQTNPTATPNAETTTFLFAGGLGWITQPVTEGFELSVNGQAVLRFDLPEPNAKSAEWKSTDGSVTLRFDVVKIESRGEDFLGRFSLTIPTTSLLPNGTAQITVKSLGSGSNRWFALNTLRSFEEKE